MLILQQEDTGMRAFSVRFMPGWYKLQLVQFSLETAARRMGSWFEMVASLRVTNRSEYEHGSRGHGEDSVRAAVNCRECALAIALELSL
jgi:hypothetical protein